MNAYWSAGFNLLSAVIGAVIGGGATVWAQITSARIQRKREEIAEATLIRGFIQSIADEINSVWNRYNVEIGPHLKGLPDDQVARVFPLHQSYFVVFDSNASLVGRIPDKELRERIISTYVEAKVYVDLMDYYERLLVNANPNLPAYILSHDDAQRHLDIVAYSKQLKLAHVMLEAKVKALQDSLQAYLDC
jgi:hypothetical protein